MTAMASPCYGAEMRTFFGVDAISMETSLEYVGGTETYEYSGLRLRYGVESSEGGSAGIEFIPRLDDRQVDPFGNLFELVTGPSIGAYFTVGAPVYLRLGISVSETEYTDVAAGDSDKDTVSAIDVGIGFNFSASSNLTFYGEFLRKDSSEADFGRFFTADIDQISDVISLGVNYLF